MIPNKFNNPKIGIIGFGEVGQVFVNGLLKKTQHVLVYDMLLKKKGIYWLIE